MRVSSAELRGATESGPNDVRRNYKGGGRNASQPNVTVQREFLPEQEMTYVTAKWPFKRARLDGERA